jgi:hypothetical protein
MDVLSSKTSRTARSCNAVQKSAEGIVESGCFRRPEQFGVFNRSCKI